MARVFRKPRGRKGEGIYERRKRRRIAELREKAIMDEKAAERFGYNKGKEDGKKEGENLGYTNGKLEEKLNLAKKMKEKNIEIDLIMEITNLSKAEIEKL